MASRYGDKPGNKTSDKFVELSNPTNPTNPTVSSGSSQQGSQNTSWQNSQQQSTSRQRSASVQGSQQTSRNVSEGVSEQQSTSFAGIEDPEALGLLMDFIRQTAAGGTADQKAQRAERLNQLGKTRRISTDYTTDQAMSDAAMLMAQQLRQSYEKSAPMIAKAVQGAGTSADAMQGLLSQKLATETAQASGALGAEQAKAYGQVQAQLQSVMEALTRIDPSAEQSLIKALELTRVQRSRSTGSSRNYSLGESQGTSFGASTSSTDSQSTGSSAGGSQGTSYGTSSQKSSGGGGGGGGGSYLAKIPTGEGPVSNYAGGGSFVAAAKNSAPGEWYEPQTISGNSTGVGRDSAAFEPVLYDYDYGTAPTYQGEVPAEDDTWGYGD